MKSYMCVICGFVYNEADGLPDEGIAPGTKWEDVPVDVFDPGLTIAGGSRIEFTCEYDNPEDRPIYQGPRTSDEMCMLIGSYYPAQPHVGACSGREDAPQETNFLGAECNVFPPGPQGQKRA